MIFKKLHLGSMSFSGDTLDEIRTLLAKTYSKQEGRAGLASSSVFSMPSALL
jgi:hypothetical protein